MYMCGVVDYGWWMLNDPLSNPNLIFRLTRSIILLMHAPSVWRSGGFNFFFLFLGDFIFFFVGWLIYRMYMTFIL